MKNSKILNTIKKETKIISYKYEFNKKNILNILLYIIFFIYIINILIIVLIGLGLDITYLYQYIFTEHIIEIFITPIGIIIGAINSILLILVLIFLYNSEFKKNFDFILISIIYYMIFTFIITLLFSSILSNAFSNRIQENTGLIYGKQIILIREYKIINKNNIQSKYILNEDKNNIQNKKEKYCVYLNLIETKSIKRKLIPTNYCITSLELKNKLFIDKMIKNINNTKILLK